jgi:hypothetical protein
MLLDPELANYVGLLANTVGFNYNDKYLAVQGFGNFLPLFLTPISSSCAAPYA